MTFSRAYILLLLDELGFYKCSYDGYMKFTREKRESCPHIVIYVKKNYIHE